MPPVNEEIAEPYICAKTLVDAPPKTSKQLLEERIKKRLEALKMNVVTAERATEARKIELNVLISNIEACMTEHDVVKLCSGLGI